MRYTYSSNFGCLIAILVMFMMFSFLGVISRLVFATPLGIVLLITAGVWYIMRSRETPKTQESSFENPSETENGFEATKDSEEEILHNHNAPKREADDVDFTEIDE